MILRSLKHDGSTPFLGAKRHLSKTFPVWALILLDVGAPISLLSALVSHSNLVLSEEESGKGSLPSACSSSSPAPLVEGGREEDGVPPSSSSSSGPPSIGLVRLSSSSWYNHYCWKSNFPMNPHVRPSVSASRSVLSLKGITFRFHAYRSTCFCMREHISNLSLPSLPRTHFLQHTFSSAGLFRDETSSYRKV